MVSALLSTLAVVFVICSAFLGYRGHMTCYIELSDTTCITVAMLATLSLIGGVALLISHETLILASMGCELFAADKIEIACSVLYSLPLTLLWDKALIRGVTAVFGVTDEWWDPEFIKRGAKYRNYTPSAYFNTGHNWRNFNNLYGRGEI